MNNSLFVVSPLYLAVGAVIAMLVVQEFMRGLPRRYASHHRRHHHRPHRQAR